MRFIDLDGTLVDLWPRYYQVFCTLLHAGNVTLEQYKKSKQQYIKDEKVAKSLGYKLPKGYFFEKAQLLEEKKYLALDHLLMTKEEIKNIFGNKKTILLTKRRFPEHLEWQLNQWGLHIPTVTVSDTKLQWLQEHCSEKSIIVGDSLMDLEAGKLDIIFPLMVGYGLGTKAQFDDFGVPYIYLDTVQKMYKYLSYFQTVSNGM